MPPVVNVTQTTIARTDAVPSILLPQQRPAPGRVTQERLQRLFAAHADQLGFDAREAPELAKALLGVMAQTQSIFDSDALRRADAATDTAFLSRQLLYIDPTKYQVKYPDVRWRDLVPVKTDVPSGADSFSTEMFDEISDSGNTAAGAGANADGEDYSDSASMTEIQGSETIGKIRPLIKAYVLMPGCLEHIIQRALHFFPYRKTVRFYDHAAANRRIFGQIGTFYDLVIPLGVVLRPLRKSFAHKKIYFTTETTECTEYQSESLKLCHSR